MMNDYTGNVVEFQYTPIIETSLRPIQSLKDLNTTIYCPHIYVLDIMLTMRTLNIFLHDHWETLPDNVKSGIHKFLVRRAWKLYQRGERIKKRQGMDYV